MKKLFLISFFILTIGLSACAFNISDIYGEWEGLPKPRDPKEKFYMKNPPVERFTFNPDGSVTMTIYVKQRFKSGKYWAVNADIYNTQKGTWSIKGNKLTITFDGKNHATTIDPKTFSCSFNSKTTRQKHCKNLKLSPNATDEDIMRKYKEMYTIKAITGTSQAIISTLTKTKLILSDNKGKKSEYKRFSK